MKSFSIKPGEKVKSGDSVYIISSILDMETVLAKDAKTDESKRLFINDLSPVLNTDDCVSSEMDITLINDKDWNIAQRRFELILPLLNNKHRTKIEIEEVAAKATVHIATIYRWISAYEGSKVLTSLLPTRRDGGRGKSRLQKDAEEIVKATIEDYYLTKQRPSVQKTCIEVARRCRNAGIAAPHPNTVRNRIAIITEKVKTRHRIDRRLVEEKYALNMGHFPGADKPLDVVQVDHTKVDIDLVDELDRAPIGRPWITVAIDVFSRMVLGFYISFDPPSAMSTGLCLAHAILPKEKWLAEHGISTPWPVWGIMRRLHTDNAREFRGELLKRVCLQYGIELNLRPIKKPHYGGHIESLLGTFMKDVHALPGTTFSNIREKRGYDSEAKASMTLKEFEQWLAIYIAETYHQSFHNGILMSPISKYEEGVFGKGDMKGSGLPDRIVDEEGLLLDFMPFLERTVQKYGIIIDNIHYYHDTLRPWVNAVDPEDKRRKRLFLIRRDPRDISAVFFYDPELKMYFRVPYRDTSRPAVSVWEVREARRKAVENGRKDINEELIFDGIERMRKITEDSVKKTRKMRRNRQRRLSHNGVLPHAKDPDEHNLSDFNVHDDIKPFEEMEEY